MDYASSLAEHQTRHFRGVRAVGDEEWEPVLQSLSSILRPDSHGVKPRPESIQDGATHHRPVIVIMFRGTKSLIAIRSIIFFSKFL